MQQNFYGNNIIITDPSINLRALDGMRSPGNGKVLLLR